MTDILHEKIRTAQILAGERGVTRHLEGPGPRKLQETEEMPLRAALRSLIHAWEDPGPMGALYEMSRAISYAKSVLGEAGL